MGTGIDCRVHVDGVRLPDGTIGDDPFAPTALSGLKVTWGRSTTLDQPEPASCTFDVMDLPGGATFVQQFKTGVPIDVYSTGLEDTGDASAMTDPGFEAGAPGATVPTVHSNAVVSYSTRHATGAQGALMTPADLTKRMWAAFPPAPFSAEVDAWDAIPVPAIGDRWPIGATVRAPAGSTVTVGPALFADPTGAGAQLPAGGVTVAGTGDWAALDTVYVGSGSAHWLGVAVTVSGFPTWAATPGTWADQTGSWLDRGVASVDDLIVTAPAGGSARTVSVFSGRVTDLEADFDESVGCPVVHVTAQDFTADLENVDVGDEPWSVESMEDRFLRIVGLSGFDLTSVIDASVADIPVSYQDVDAQGSAGLLRDLAQSVDAVMWPAVHTTTGAYLRVEDPANRAALFTLEMIGGKVQIVPAGSAAASLDISACDVLREPVRWEQSVSDVSTRVAVEWLEQAVDGDGLPTTNSHTETRIDAGLELDHGKRRISVSTLLTTATDAGAVASRILARTGVTGWRVSGFQIVDDASLEVIDADTITMMMRLLDGTSRIGLPIRLVDLPVWAPTAPTVGVYLEGGEYLFANGAWTLSLTVSSAVSVGESAPWNEIPAAWRWVDFDPSISWLDMVGVAAPAGGKIS